MTRRVHRILRCTLAGSALCATYLAMAPPVAAQVPPSPVEASAYLGLHAAVWQGEGAREG